MLNRFMLHEFAQAVRFATLRAYKNNDWRQIPIRDNGEPLVSVPEIVIRPNIPEEIKCAFPYYHEYLGITEDRRLFARRTVVVEKLTKAQEIMRQFRCYLVVYAAWHSNFVQDKLFWIYMKQFTARKFNLEAEFEGAQETERIREVFLSLPETMRVTLMRENRTHTGPASDNLAIPSPHTTGGALNVWPYSGGEALDLGIPYNWMSEEAGAFYHLKRGRKKFVGNDGLLVYNRDMLIYAMVKAGFSCYGPQIWHFNYGNQMHALATKQKEAIYGHVEL